MPNFVPCRTGDDQDVHLYPGEESDTALCGKTVDDATTTPGDRRACVACGRRLLARIFQLAGPGGIASVEITVHAP